MILNYGRRKIIAKDCQRIREMEQLRNDFKVTGQFEEASLVEERLLIAYWFVLSHLEMLINERDGLI